MWLTRNDLGLPLSTNPPTPAASTAYNANNRLTDTTHFQYDGAGNQILVGNYSLTYDAENHQFSSTNVSGVLTSYTYDGDGRRVLKTSNGTHTVYVYDSAGQLAAEYTDGATGTGCQTCYLSFDHLGSTRMVTDQNQQVIERHDYMPFGEEIINGYAGRGTLWGMASGVVNQKFTSKERDSESQLDYFGARYYGSSTGRWASPDPSNLGVDIYMPQTWNRYNYAVNNPLAIKDSNGLWPFYVHDQIIKESFPGMSKEDLKALTDASWNMDFAPHQQDARNSNMRNVR